MTKTFGVGGLGALVLALAAACGGTSQFPSGAGDAGGPSSGSGSGSSSGGASGSSSGSSSGGGVLPEDAGPPCTTDSQCATGTQCLFYVGSCSAQGQCLSPSSLGGECEHLVAYCGCNGQTIGGLCGPNYAYGPTLGGDAPCSPTPSTPNGGTLTTLAQISQSAPELLAVDATNVYFAGTGTGDVYAVPIGGGSVTTLATSQNQPIGIAAANGDVFWTNESSGTGGTIMKVAATGGTPVPLATAQGAPFEIATDGTNVYWTNITAPLGVMTAPISGATPATLFASAASPWAIAVSGGVVYWSDSDAVFSKPTAGGNVTTIASNQGFVFSLAPASNGNLYFVSGTAGTLLSVAATGGTPTTLASGYTDARLAVDSTSVYFTTQGVDNDGLVLSLPLDGGTPTTLATGQSTPEALVVDATSAYWVDTDVGAVMKLSPK